VPFICKLLGIIAASRLIQARIMSLEYMMWRNGIWYSSRNL